MTMNITLLHGEDDRLQRPVTREQLIAMCETAFIGIPVTEVREIEGGLWNNTYLVVAGGAKFVLRVSPHSDLFLCRYEQALMRREYAIQPYIIPMGSLFPKTVFTDFTRRICDRDYTVQTFLEGTNWEFIKNDLAGEENDRIWYEVGAIAKELCAVTGERFGPPSPAEQFDTWSGYLTSYITGMRDDMAAHGYVYPELDAFIEAFSRFSGVLNAIGKPRLVHGDLWEKNILIEQANGKWRVSGVLDSERAYWGDEISEWIHTFVNVSPAYWEGYGALYCPDQRALRKLLYDGVTHVQGAAETRMRNLEDPAWAMAGLARITQELARQ